MITFVPVGLDDAVGVHPGGTVIAALILGRRAVGGPGILGGARRRRSKEENITLR